MIDRPTVGQVPLGEVAQLTIILAPNEIKREAASRRIDITCNVDGPDLASLATDASVATDIKRADLANVRFKTGSHSEFLGEYAQANTSRKRLLLIRSGD